MLVRGYSELSVEGVIPDLLHVVPVLNDTVFYGVGDLEHSSLVLGLITQILFLLFNSH